LPGFGFAIRNLFFPMIGADDRAHRPHGRDGIGCAHHVHQDLAVWITIFDGLDQLQRKSRLAHAAEAMQGDDGLAGIKLGFKLLQLFVAACEIRGRISDEGKSGDLFWFLEIIIVCGLVDGSASKIIGIAALSNRPTELPGEDRALNASGNVGLCSVDGLAALIHCRPVFHENSISSIRQAPA